MSDLLWVAGKDQPMVLQRAAIENYVATTTWSSRCNFVLLHTETSASSDIVLVAACRCQSGPRLLAGVECNHSFHRIT
eukprot:scaffold351882_cov20-Prasinocladus_malaysianus.AAC.1